MQSSVPIRTAVMAADALSEKEKLKIENLALLERVAALEATAAMAADALSEKEIENLALLERVAALEQANQALLDQLVATKMFKGTAKVFEAKGVGNTDLPEEASNDDWII